LNRDGLDRARDGFERAATMNRTRVSPAMGLVGIVAATVILVALTWLGTIRATLTERAAAAAGIEAGMARQAALFEQQVRVELLEADQTLRVLAHAWEADPDHFRLLPWRGNLVLLNQISPDIFIADDRGTVRDGTVPEWVGSEVGDRDYFRTLAERIFDDGKMFIGPSTIGPLVRQWHINLARPLHRRDGSFAGVIVAALRNTAGGKFYPMADIGTHGVIAMVGLDDGRLRFDADRSRHQHRRHRHVQGHAGEPGFHLGRPHRARRHRARAWFPSRRRPRPGGCRRSGP
jgi:hypothetical protein